MPDTQDKNRSIREGLQNSDPSIHVRVYKRTPDYLIILWDYTNLTEEQKKHVQLSVKQRDTFIPLKFTQSSAYEEYNIDKGLAITIVDHAENNLDGKRYYLIKVVLGTTELKEAYLKVTPFDELPDEEKDDKSKRTHTLIWASDKRRWVKVKGIKNDKGHYAIPVALVNNSDEDRRLESLDKLVLALDKVVSRLDNILSKKA